MAKASGAAPQILVAGEALIDLFQGADGGADHAAPAGSPFNVAVGLARLGVRTGFLGVFSTDADGQRLRATLQAEGVDLRWAKGSSRRSPRVVIATGPDGQPAYDFRTVGTAEQDLGPHDLPPALPPQVQAIALGSYALAVPPIAEALAVLAARETGRRVVSLDPNLRPALVGPLPAWRARIDALARMATIVKLSDEDLRSGWPGADAEALARDWLAQGVGLVVLTRGAEGATAWSRSGRLAVPAAPATVIDTVGAGDAFHAGLLARLAELDRLTIDGVARLERETLADILRFAAAAAALTCARRGADPPRRADLPSGRVR